jgi:hypothetical protein
MLHDPVVDQIFQQAPQTAVYAAHIEMNQLLWPSHPAEKRDICIWDLASAVLVSSV